MGGGRLLQHLYVSEDGGLSHLSTGIFVITVIKIHINIIGLVYWLSSPLPLFKRVNYVCIQWLYILILIYRIAQYCSILLLSWSREMDTEQTLTFHFFPLFPPNFFRLQHNNPLLRLMIHYSHVRTTPTSQRCALFLFLGKKRPLTGISWVKNDFFPVFHRDVCDDDHRGWPRLAWKHLLRLCSRKVGLSFNRELVWSHFW